MVSVIVPTYNREKLLPVAIASVRAQTFTDWELIVVDDRSTDGTAALLESFRLEDHRIRGIPNERPQGPAGARNHGMSRARGRYIAFLDSDDQWEPWHLSEAVYYLEKYPERIDLITARTVRKRRDTGEVITVDLPDFSKIPHQVLEECCLVDPDRLLDVLLQRGPFAFQITWVGKREMFEGIPWAEDILGGEDCLYVLELGRHKTRIGHLQKPHVIYWAHEDNVSNYGDTHGPERRIKVWLMFEKYQQRVLEDFPLNAAQRRARNLSLANLYFWKIAYNGYLPLGNIAKAREYFWKAIRLFPLCLPYWKALLLHGYLLRR
jgi:glycosyltransferase involved in cell wall biosynthesis